MFLRSTSEHLNRPGACGTGKPSCPILLVTKWKA